MENFGKRLRYYRNQSTDPERGGRLTQERLAELLERKGLFYTGAAVSDWERGKTRIHINDRLVLLALIQVFNDCGGMRAEEADDLLETGNYRALSPPERAQIFADEQVYSLPVLSGVERLPDLFLQCFIEPTCRGIFYSRDDCSCGYRERKTKASIF